MKSIDNMRKEIKKQSLDMLKLQHQQNVETNNKYLESLPDYQKFKHLNKSEIELKIEKLNEELETITDCGDIYER